MAKLEREDLMTITSLIRKGYSNRHIAGLLRVSEGTVRYHRRRQAGAPRSPASPASTLMAPT